MQIDSKLALHDLHCHLDLYPDFAKKVREREANAIDTLTVTTTPRAWPMNRLITNGKKYVKAALGLHPELVAQNSSELSLWSKYLCEANYIGEVGLDGRRENKKTLPLQIEVFNHILLSSFAENKKLISIHSAGAVAQTLDCIEKIHKKTTTKIVLHWFTGSPKEAERAVELGCFFSINYKMLETNKWKNMCSAIPIKKLFLETDAPFVEKKYVNNDVGLLSLALDEIAKTYNIPSEILCNMLSNNFSSVAN